MRAAMYLRQSQDRDANEHGIERQRAEVIRLVEARGWTIADTYVDNDTSASGRRPRPEFERLMADVDGGRVDVIVVRHMDRLVRRMADLEHVLERCEAHGVHIVSASDGVDTSTDGGRLVARILGSVAQGEVERKSARQRAATRQAAEQGRRVGGRRPFGYEADGTTIREDEAALIKQGIADVLAGEAHMEIARRWAASGIPTPQGGKHGWNRSAVSDVLGNPRIAGLRRHRPAGSASMLRTRPFEGIVGPAQWPAIVDEQTWRAAMLVMYPKDRQGRKTRAKALLTGVALCGVCEALVHGGGATHKYPTYRCTSNKHISRKAEPIEDYVSALVVARLSQPDARRVFTRTDDDDTRDLSAEADALRARLDEIADSFADGVLTRPQVERATARAKANLDEVERLMADRWRGNDVAQIATSEDVEAAWSRLSLARKRAVIQTLMTPVIHLVGAGVRTFAPESVEIRWH